RARARARDPPAEPGRERAAPLRPRRARPRQPRGHRLRVPAGGGALPDPRAAPRPRGGLAVAGRLGGEATIEDQVVDRLPRAARPTTRGEPKTLRVIRAPARSGETVAGRLRGTLVPLAAAGRSSGGTTAMT